MLTCMMCFYMWIKICSWCELKFSFPQVGAGLECGIGVDDFDEWEEGDVVEAFNTVKKARTLEEASATVTAALKDAGVQL
jgi:translation initiation factor IF-2